MNAIDEVNISVTRRPEHHGVARRVPCSSVRSQIARAEISLNFNDSSRKPLASIAANNQLAQQFPRDETRIAIEEGAAQKLGIALHTGRDSTCAKRSFNRRNGLSSQR